MVNEHSEILDFYDAGVEKERLRIGIGKIEFERSKEIIQKTVGDGRKVIYDIGGGTGEYSRWLAGLNHEVHLIDISPKTVEYAYSLNKELEYPVSEIQVGNALDLKLPDESADVALLMGPLYHLPLKSDRIKALKEAGRVLRSDGTLIASAISRYGSALWGLSVYGSNNSFIEEDAFSAMIDRELTDGQHIRPTEYPYLLARAFFHLPDELLAEIREAGFENANVSAIEGPVWVVPAFDEKWENAESRERLLQICRKVEAHKDIMGMSPHLIGIGKKLKR